MELIPFILSPRDLLSFHFPSFLFSYFPCFHFRSFFLPFLLSYATLPLFSSAPHLRLFPPSSSLLQGEVVVLVRSILLRGFDRDLTQQVQVCYATVSVLYSARQREQYSVL
jgi:hypothetical protein